MSMDHTSWEEEHGASSVQEWEWDMTTARNQGQIPGPGQGAAGYEYYYHPSPTTFRKSGTPRRRYADTLAASNAYAQAHPYAYEFAGVPHPPFMAECGHPIKPYPLSSPVPMPLYHPHHPHHFYADNSTSLGDSHSYNNNNNNNNNLVNNGSDNKDSNSKERRRRKRRGLRSCNSTKIKLCISLIMIITSVTGWISVEFLIWRRRQQVMALVAIPDGVEGPLTWGDLYDQATDMNLLEAQEGFHHLQQHDNNKDDSFWYPLGSVEHPYSAMTPQMDVIWSRGWYNAIPPPKTVPIPYYNHNGLEGGPLRDEGQLKLQFPPFLCGPRWMRINDVAWWAETILPLQQCEFTLITSDGLFDVPTGIPFADDILNSPLLTMWYAQNVVAKYHPKLQPLPLGLPIHYGFPGSPNSAYTLKTMLEIRKTVPPFRQRSTKILLDPGTFGEDDGPRTQARTQALNALGKCPDRVQVMKPTPVVETWSEHYSTHQFAAAVRGTGWDTYRTWEYLLFGTVPIVLQTEPMEYLHGSAHTPVVVVQQWDDICHWTDDYYNHLVDRYEGWIANAHYWLRPSLWVPRNQDEMERLCDISPGCRNATGPYPTSIIVQDPSPKEQKPQQKDKEQPNPKQNDNSQKHYENVVDADAPNKKKKEENGGILDLTHEEREKLLELLLKQASQDEIEQLLGDAVIKEKVYQQLLFASKVKTHEPTKTDFEKCIEKCKDGSKTVQCTIFQQDLTYSCK